MDSTDCGPLKELFERASALPAEEQEAFLEDACPDDPKVRAELASLVAAAREADEFFDSLADAVLSLSPWSDDEPSQGSIETSGLDPMIGRTVRQYRIEETLGRGGMGVVYRAHDTSLNRAVALKFLPRGMTGDEAATERFLIEAQAAAALDHPNVCSVYEIGEDDDGRRFIAMAYYEGETLKQKLERGPLPIEEAWDHARQIAAALGAAHARDIIHRDVKPGNVIVTPEGVAKVLDFGLAKLTDVTLTGTGTTLGTVAYMSPEQAQGNAVDHRTDLWSLGVVLYEMLTGKRPFRGESTAVTIHAIVAADPKPPSDLRPDIPAGLEAIVGRLLAKEPNQRPETAAASGLETGEVTLPEGVFAVPRTGPVAWLRSWRAAAALLLVAGAIIVGRELIRPPAALLASIDSVAVLPLQNRTGDSAQDDHVDAMHMALITELRNIFPTVLPRQSTLPYAGTELSIPGIANELEVDAVLEGNWYRNGDVVEIEARLTRAQPERREWSQNIEGRADDMFAVHRELARELAAALGMTLSPEVEARLDRGREVDQDARVFYMQAQEHFGRGLEIDNMQSAIGLYAQAIAADPEYASAHAMLAYALHLAQQMPGGVALPDSVQRTLERALALDPSLPEAQLALGYTTHDDDRKWEAYENALANRPSPETEAEIHRVMGQRRRALGQWEEAVVNGRRAVDLNPRSSALLIERARTLMMMREYDEWERTLDKAIVLEPDRPFTKLWRGILGLLRDGDADQMRDWVGRAARSSSPVDLFTGMASMSPNTVVPFIDESFRAEILAAPVDRFTEVRHPQSYRFLVRAMLMEQADRTAEARVFYDSARLVLEGEDDATGRPGLQVRLGQAYAGLGLKEQAIEAAAEGVARVRNAFIGPLLAQHLAEIYVRVGEYDAAIDQLDSLLSIPSWLSVPYLRVHPAWDPLRDNRRFQALLDRYE